jgi:hypothetical protein
VLPCTAQGRAWEGRARKQPRTGMMEAGSGKNGVFYLRFPKRLRRRAGVPVRGTGKPRKRRQGRLAHAAWSGSEEREGRRTPGTRGSKPKAEDRRRVRAASLDQPPQPGPRRGRGRGAFKVGPKAARGAPGGWRTHERAARGAPGRSEKQRPLSSSGAPRTLRRRVFLSSLLSAALSPSSLSP